jgi:hypothetical protein
MSFVAKIFDDMSMSECPFSHANTPTFSQLDGKKNTNKAEVVIQGKVTREVSEYLQQAYGLPNSAVAIEGKKKK